MVFPTKYVALLLLVFVMKFLATLFIHEQDPDEHFRTLYENWIEKHVKEYKSDIEKEAKYQIFKNNNAFINSFNEQGNKTYKLALNQFADLTQEQFVNSYTGLDIGRKLDSLSKRPFRKRFRYNNVKLDAIPERLDWSELGAVTPVKNQGECNCCYTFASVEALESIIKIKTGNLITLSEQQVLDCSTENDGCQGGLSSTAFDYMRQSGGVTTESNYPYMGKAGVCRDANFTKAATIRGYESVPANNEKALLQAVANQPISVSIDSRKVQFYSHGVMTGDCGTDLNHELLLVGYGTDSDGIQYWRMKNSWGREWGEDGYLRFQKNVDDPKGMCGIAMMATYPLV